MVAYKNIKNELCRHAVVFVNKESFHMKQHLLYAHVSRVKEALLKKDGSFSCRDKNFNAPSTLGVKIVRRKRKINVNINIVKRKKKKKNKPDWKIKLEKSMSDDEQHFQKQQEDTKDTVTCLHKLFHEFHVEVKV